MEKPVICYVNQLLDAQLSTGIYAGHASAATGFDFMVILPYVIIPFLFILIAGICILDQYRRRTTF